MAVIERKPTKNGKPDPKGKSRWLVRIDVTDPVTGARKQKIIGTFRNETEAKRAERDALTMRDKGTLIDPSKATVAVVLDDWLRSKAGAVSPNSLKDYEIVVRRHIKPALGTVRAQGLTPARLQHQYDAWREAGLSARMIRGCHMRLSQAFDQAERHGVVQRNPCRSVRPPALARHTVESWSVEEVAAFLDAAAHRPILTRRGDSGRRHPDPLWPLWPLLALEGLRKGEALGLRWRDVNLERGVVSIVQTVAADKSNAGRVMIQSRTKTAAGSRTVRLTRQTIDALRDHRKRQLEQRLASPDWIDCDLIVCTSKGTPVNPGGNVNRSFDAIVEAARLPDGTPLRRIRIHDLRHTAATLLLGAGIPAKIVSERLGHATIGITLDLYSHVTADMQGDAAARIGDLLARASGK